jgi:hypothetical protein
MVICRMIGGYLSLKKPIFTLFNCGWSRRAPSPCHAVHPNPLWSCVNKSFFFFYIYIYIYSIKLLYSIVDNYLTIHKYIRMLERIESLSCGQKSNRTQSKVWNVEKLWDPPPFYILLAYYVFGIVVVI